MTTAGRFKRSLACAVLAVIVSSAAVLTLGIQENRANARGSSIGELPIDLLGIALAPGWFLIRGMFERSSMNQLLGWALIIPSVSVVVDTGVIFGIWQLVHRVHGVTSKSLSS
jgi:hypothetical protein